MKEIDINSWNRKEHYQFFASMVNPYLGITANVRCTKAYATAKKNKLSFYAYYLHKSMQAVNAIVPFKYRIIEDKVYEIDNINAGMTIMRQDETFGFAYVVYDEDFETFNQNLQAEIHAVQDSTGLRLNTENAKMDMVRCTTIPWVSFTSLLHPTNHSNKESIPKVSFGKMFQSGDDWYLPTSVEANHGLMDGYHISQYFQLFEKLLEE